MDFKVKEGTHIVLKVEDVNKLDPDRLEDLKETIKDVNIIRNNENKKVNDYLVINVDEPYANEIREVIKRGEEAKARAKKISLKEAWNDLLTYVKALSVLPKEDQQTILNILDTIRPHIVYPTLGEVCIKLGKYLNRSVYFSDNKFRVLGFVYGENVDLNLLDQEHLALVGRFFEGLENK